MTISRDIANYDDDVDFLVQEADAGPPESKIDDLPFERDSLRSKIYMHKTADL